MRYKCVTEINFFTFKQIFFWNPLKTHFNHQEKKTTEEMEVIFKVYIIMRCIYLGICNEKNVNCFVHAALNKWKISLDFLNTMELQTIRAIFIPFRKHFNFSLGMYYYYCSKYFRLIIFTWMTTDRVFKWYIAAL